jgi:hypothetical protein
LPRGAVRLGAVGPASKLHLDITLKVRDQAALTAFLAGLSNRQSPMFHRVPAARPVRAAVRPDADGDRGGAGGAAAGRPVTWCGLRQPAGHPGHRVGRGRRARVRHLPDPVPDAGRVAYANSAAPRIAGTADLVGFRNRLRADLGVSAHGTSGLPGASMAARTAGRHGVAWHGVVWCGVVWCGVVWCAHLQ